MATMAQTLPAIAGRAFQSAQGSAMTARLKRLYVAMLLPAVFVGAGLLAAQALDHPVWVKLTGLEHLARWFFIFCIVFAVAAPVLQRALFAHHMRGRQYTPASVFFIFQKRLIISALIAPYMALAAALAQLPRFYQAGVILASLYAVYYYYPSNRRIGADVRIFRVKSGSDD